MLAADLHAKIDEQIDRTVHLIDMLPEGSDPWRPPVDGAWSVGELLGHLLDCLAGFCAVLYRTRPEPLREVPLNAPCSPAEARRWIGVLRGQIQQGFVGLTDADLAKKLPTVFVPEGESELTLLLGNFEHLVNHKHQLFMYLKLMGVTVATPDLYVFR